MHKLVFRFYAEKLVMEYWEQIDGSLDEMRRQILRELSTSEAVIKLEPDWTGVPAVVGEGWCSRRGWARVCRMELETIA